VGIRNGGQTSRDTGQEKIGCRNLLGNKCGGCTVCGSKVNFSGYNWMQIKILFTGIGTLL
jgi:hypothetical protein